MLSYSSDKANEMKKNKKLRENEPSGTRKRENLPSFLGSVFDILLIKKDILNRYTSILQLSLIRKIIML